MKALILTFVILTIVLFGLNFLVSESLEESEIVNFAPHEFDYKLEKPAFYIANNKLYYSKKLDGSELPILEGEIRNVIVSPDNQKSIIVSDEKLYLYNAIDRSAYSLGDTVDTFTKRKITIDANQPFLRNDLIQWKRDSSGFYVAEDRLQHDDNPRVELISKNASLLEYTLGEADPKVVIDDFWSSTYFLDEVGNIYYNLVNEKGQLPQYKRSSNGEISPVRFADLNKDRMEKGIFTNFNYFRKELLAAEGIEFNSSIGDDRSSNLTVRGTRVLEFIEGTTIKSATRSVFVRSTALTPDNRYLVAEIRNTDYAGNILIDLATLEYKVLDKNVLVFRSYSTLDIDLGQWAIFDDGIRVVY